MPIPDAKTPKNFPKRRDAGASSSSSTPTEQKPPSSPSPKVHQQPNMPIYQPPEPLLGQHPPMHLLGQPPLQYIMHPQGGFNFTFPPPHTSFPVYPFPGQFPGQTQVAPPFFPLPLSYQAQAQLLPLPPSPLAQAQSYTDTKAYLRASLFDVPEDRNEEELEFSGPLQIEEQEDILFENDDVVIRRGDFIVLPRDKAMKKFLPPGYPEPEPQPDPCVHTMLVIAHEMDKDVLKFWIDLADGSNYQNNPGHLAIEDVLQRWSIGGNPRKWPLSDNLKKWH